jgi:hypothetical protein
MGEGEGEHAFFPAIIVVHPDLVEGRRRKERRKVQEGRTEGKAR